MGKKRVLSFKYAFAGIWIALKEEPNLKFHFFAAILVLTVSAYLQITTVEWLVVLLTIGMVIALELTNSAIESIVDSFTSERHPGAKKAKDISSGAVLAASVAAALVGILIFLPYIVDALISLE